MGIFDKILEKIKGNNEEHPLADETVKKYYEIAYGLLASMWSDRDVSPYKVRYKGIKKYVEHFIGEQCDEEKLQKALAYFDRENYNYGPTNASYALYKREDWLIAWYPSIKLSKFAANKIVETNRILAENTTYRCATREDFFVLCFYFIKNPCNIITNF